MYPSHTKLFRAEHHNSVSGTNINRLDVANPKTSLRTATILTQSENGNRRLPFADGKGNNHRPLLKSDRPQKERGHANTARAAATKEHVHLKI